ncbi:NAD(P)-binding protein [Sistotremastrum suecicum HHB10207 ss-3]|uniref:NAD(P)-binding protein n=1 Tax=Sistotremastrum suecicum HHB10207 ss-3 TaxID=1314776 RepID=A0A166HJ29_9AGAM|nr:NAD(P)-binding protein [Sistotremastrum suecicum HHB10207 ss-3]
MAWSLFPEWHGLDTLIVCAGVSALRPLLAVAGVERAGGVFTPEKPSADGLERVKEVAFAAIHGNYLGPMLAAVTFIPLLTTTSTSPAILQISSAAAVVPAPTRSLYGSTKAASLMLYRSLAIEHPEITFSYVLPATVEGDFRASAVDGGPIREDLTHGLKREVVAAACLRAVDRHIRHVFLPSAWSALPFLYALLPNFIERMASRKYKFNRS